MDTPGPPTGIAVHHPLMDSRMHTFRRASVALAAVLTLASCGSTDAPPGIVSAGLHPSPDEVSATVLTRGITAGAAVDVKFVNRGRVAIMMHHPCTRRVERRDGDGWTLLPSELRLCIAEVYKLRAGSEEVKVTDVPIDVTPGEYRFRFPVTFEARSAVAGEVVSAPFTVRAQ